MRGTWPLRIGHVSLILCFNIFVAKRHRGGRQCSSTGIRNIINTPKLVTVLFYERCEMVFVRLTTITLCCFAMRSVDEILLEITEILRYIVRLTSDAVLHN